MIGALFTLLIYLVIVAILVALVYYVVDAIPLPPPVGRLIKIAVVVIACLIIILLLLSLVGNVNLNLPRVGT